MNEIELNAMVALEHLADLVFYIFDASETSGYPLESQLNLYHEINHVFKTPIQSIFNKMDLVEDKEHVNEYIEQMENPLLISASEGTGVPEIIAKMEEFHNESEK
jgi:nucleolar GTP-binding protein